ncbi:hypothetical protein AX15_007053 [Amanita polypyramis BW_CC]|nr:hypothetical protein AX15_007053 [Amanita polypyramis BW_CC]
MPAPQPVQALPPLVHLMTPGKKDSPPNSSLKRDKEREKAEKEFAAAAAATERLKTVVRRLPPNLPEEVFWQSVQQWVTDETVTWRVFHPGKLKKKINKENIPSRAYIAFRNEKVLAQFSREYDGHVFRDKQGNEAHAVVEFAPYQKIPSEKKKVDARNATIEKDEDYISFIDSLNAPVNPEPVSIEVLIAATQVPAMPKTTPLLEALKAEKSASRDKEAILRNHAHYKDPTVLTSVNAMRTATIATGASSAKEDSGKKKGVATSQQKEAESSRKGKKAQAAGGQTSAAKQQAAAVSPGKRESAPPTKLLRAARQQAAAAKIAAAAQVTHPQARVHAPAQSKVNEVLPVSASSSGEGSGTAAPTGTPSTIVAAQVGAAAAAPRRARPVVGLGSRQLQAALSQVGAAAVERKRREREREVLKEDPCSNVNNGIVSVAEGSSEKSKEFDLDVDAAAPVSPVLSAVGKEDREKPKSAPSSPRRDRKKKEKNGHQPEASQRVPSIMQRPEGVPPPALQRNTPGQVLPGHAQVHNASVNHAGGIISTGPMGGPPFRGGPRRGRGRGRGGFIHRGG